MENIKKTKCLISNDQPIKAKITSALEFGIAKERKLVRFSFDYNNQEQIRAINKEYGGIELIDESHCIGKQTYDGVTYLAFTNTKAEPKVDFVEIIGNFDLNVPIKRFVEYDNMSVLIDDLVISGKYDESMHEKVVKRFDRLAEDQEMECILKQMGANEAEIERNKRERREADKEI